MRIEYSRREGFTLLAIYLPEAELHIALAPLGWYFCDEYLEADRHTGRPLALVKSLEDALLWVFVRIDQTTKA